MRIRVASLGMVVFLAFPAAPALAQIVPPFTSFTPVVPPFSSMPMVPRPHPRPPFPPPVPVPFPFLGYGAVNTYQPPANINVIVSPPPPAPEPPVVYNPPTTETTATGIDIVRLMSTSPARP